MVPTNGALGGLPDGGLVFCHNPTARRPSGWLSLSHSRGFARYSTILSAESRVGSLEMQFDLDTCMCGGAAARTRGLLCGDATLSQKFLSALR